MPCLGSHNDVHVYTFIYLEFHLIPASKFLGFVIVELYADVVVVHEYQISLACLACTRILHVAIIPDQLQGADFQAAIRRDEHKQRQHQEVAAFAGFWPHAMGGLKATPLRFNCFDDLLPGVETV